ncbi:sugar ABC transporter permease, partial [Phytoactinopolyspora halotolerans]|nr:sugar ABC transporter permease [Phytoactinopolyspora halotolerans]
MAVLTRQRTRGSEARRPKTPFFHRRWVVAMVFMLPFLVLFGVFRVYAVGYAVVLSFQDIEGIGVSEWSGFSNYRRLFSDSTFFTALRNTALYTAGTLLVLVPVPFVLAAVLQSKLVARQAALRSAFFLPV